MNFLQSHYPHIKQFLLENIPAFWPDLKVMAEKLLQREELPELIPVLASCKAVGGKPENSIRLAAAFLAAEISVRVMDDLLDMDKPNSLWKVVGKSRAYNFADAFKTLAFQIIGENVSSGMYTSQIQHVFTNCYMVTLAGQDRDLLGSSIQWKEYWKTIEMKTAYIYATLAMCGALTGTSDPELIQACRKYGFNHGMIIQIFNDLEGVWYPEGSSDLEQGKITLPLVYALQCDHLAKEELQQIVLNKQISSQTSRILAILNDIDTKSYLIWAALQHRKQALEAIQNCPDEEGKQLLTFHVNGMFGDIDELLKKPQNFKPAMPTYGLSANSVSDLSQAETLSDSKHGASEYESLGLSIRSRMRNIN